MALAADYQVVVNGDAQRLGRGLLAPLVGMAVGDRLGVHRQMRVVELFDPLLSLVCWRDLCGVDRSTVHRWLKDETAVPHAVIRLLETRQKVGELHQWLGNVS
jgi:hypothetical protein